MSDTKTCPYCGEEVKAAAKKCNCCHSMLEETTKQSFASKTQERKPTKPKKPIWKRWWVWVAAVLVFFIFIGSMGGNDDAPSSRTESPSSSPQEEAPEEVAVPVVVTVDELIDALRTNALKAANTYKDQYVELTGRLSNIDSDGKYFSLGILSNEFSLDTVLCRIEKEHLDAVMNFEVGQEVTVTGTITSVGEVMGYTLKVETIK